MALHLLQDLLVRVPVDERGVRGQRRPVIDAVVEPGAIDVPVGKEERLPVCRRVDEHVVVGHAGEAEDHLIDLRLTVAPHRDDNIPVPA